MAKEKVCRKCNVFVDDDVCPLCKGNNFTTTYKGVIYVVDVENSMFSEKADITTKGFYAIQSR